MTRRRDKARAVRLPVHMIEAYNKVSKSRREFEAAQADWQLSVERVVKVEP